MPSCDGIALISLVAAFCQNLLQKSLDLLSSEKYCCGLARFACSASNEVIYMHVFDAFFVFHLGIQAES